jgi:hypothetical protein
VIGQKGRKIFFLEKFLDCELYPGLLQLAFPITFTKYISPLCLPASGETGFVDNSTSAAINVTALDTQGAVP